MNRKMLVEVVPSEISRKWEVVVHRGDTPSVVQTQRRQKDAHRSARAVCVALLYVMDLDSIELQVRGRNGQIKHKDTFGYDPRDTAG
jgi:inosine/xanthosine triphosphate pyrophosphatase family protein